MGKYAVRKIWPYGTGRAYRAGFGHIPIGRRRPAMCLPPGRRWRL